MRSKKLEAEGTSSFFIPLDFDDWVRKLPDTVRWKLSNYELLQVWKCSAHEFEPITDLTKDIEVARSVISPTPRGGE